MATFLENFRNIAQTNGSNKTTGTNKAFIPKAPEFKYKNPAVDNDIAYWKVLADDRVMKNYDKFMYILDEASTLDSLQDRYKYVGQLRRNLDYKVNPAVRAWVDDFEGLIAKYDGKYGVYDLDLPIDIMRNQTIKAKKALEQGYKVSKEDRIKDQSLLETIVRLLND